MSTNSTDQGGLTTEQIDTRALGQRGLLGYRGLIIALATCVSALLGLWLLLHYKPEIVDSVTVGLFFGTIAVGGGGVGVAREWGKARGGQG